jgi:hypothetical protein
LQEENESGKHFNPAKRNVSLFIVYLKEDIESQQVEFRENRVSERSGWGDEGSQSSDQEEIATHH